jgi:LPS O-antigen subunit length determinant protein (WzzB/FepE family)
MQEAHSNKHPNDFDDEIDLRELFYVLLEGKMDYCFSYRFCIDYWSYL